MKHTKVIQPTDHSELPSNTLPDRSNLSKLYVPAKENQMPQEESVTDADLEGDELMTNPATINRTSVSLLLTVPLAATYLAAIYIYHGADANIERPDPFFPLLSFFVSGLWLLLCIVSFRILVKKFYNYNASLSTFILVYLFYILPVIKLTYDLFTVNFTGIVLTITMWLIANYLIVLYMTWSLNRSGKSSVSKMFIIILPILVLIVCAAIL